VPHTPRVRHSHAARHAHHLTGEKVPVRVKSRTLEDEEMLMSMTRFLCNIMHGRCNIMYGICG
jgi:hypothetical protein